MGEILIHPQAREVRVHQNMLSLTPKEFDLLYLLAKYPNKVFSREALLEQVWGNFSGDSRTVDQHVKNVREKTRKAGGFFNPIQTYKIKEPVLEDE